MGESLNNLEKDFLRDQIDANEQYDIDSLGEDYDLPHLEGKTSDDIRKIWAEIKRKLEL